MKKLYFILSCSTLLFACTTGSVNHDSSGIPGSPDSNTVAVAPVKMANAVYDTVKSLDNMHDSVSYFMDSEGRVYMAKQIFSGKAMMAAKLICDTDAFFGTARRNAKMTKLSVAYQTYATTKLMMKSLPDDSVMRNHIPPVTTDTNSVRVSEEKRNVIITTSWLYAIKREDDNDFHLIIGTDTTPQQSELFNVEVSGLPEIKSTSFSTLKMVRDTIINRFGKICKTSYTTFSPPMKISVRGSLFYDIDHAPGVVGPAGFRPQTSWEIHPVTKIQFK